MSPRTSRTALVLSRVSLSLVLLAVAGCETRAQPESQALGELPTTTLGPDPDSPQYAPTGDAGEPAPPSDGAEQAPEEAAPSFTQERLEQLVAPVALYPDPLLMEILMAATYPAEVAEAAIWRKENPGLNGKELDAAIADKGWDVSVNSLTHATKALDLMAADPQWTKDLGDAFLAQQDDVLNAVQIMRSRACDLGNLKTTEQQQVIIEDAPATPPAPQQSVPLAVERPTRIVRVVPVQPEIIHIPVYNPRVIYGPPPPMIYYPRVMLYPAISVGISPIISFGVGLTIGGLLWGDCDWHNHRVYSRRYGGGYYGGGYYDRYRDGGYRRDDYGSHAQVWRHDSRHRRGVDYHSRHVERIYRSSDSAQYRDDLGDGRSPQGGRGDVRDGRGGFDGRDGARGDVRDGSRDGSRDKGGLFDRRRGDSGGGGRPDSADKPRSSDRGPGDSRGKPGMFGSRPKSSDRVEDKSRGGGAPPKSSAVSPRGPSNKGSSGRPDAGQAVRPGKPSKPGGGSSYRPPSGDKRGGGSSMQRGGSSGGAQRGGGGGSIQRGGNSGGAQRGGGGGSMQRGGSSGGQGGRGSSMQGGGGSHSRGGGGSSRGGGGQQRGGSQRGGGNDRGGGGGKQGGR